MFSNDDRFGEKTRSRGGFDVNDRYSRKLNWNTPNEVTVFRETATGHRRHNITLNITLTRGELDLLVHCSR